MHVDFFLHILFAMGLILITSRLVGGLCIKIGQPRVVGEMVAGVLLGPTFFGWILQEQQQLIFNPEIKKTLFIISNLGLAFYMFLVGAELDFQVVRKHGKQAWFLAFSGIIPSMLVGGVMGFWLYDTLSVQSVSPWLFALFLASAISITAFPMLARILQENKLASSKMGSLALVAASVDDAVAWSLLAVVTALGQNKSIMGAFHTILGTLTFVIISVIFLKPLLHKFIGIPTTKNKTLSQEHFFWIVLLVLTAAWFTDYIGVHSVFGGFIMGAVMPKDKHFIKEVFNKIHDFVVIVMLPLFFTYSGLNTKLDFFSQSILIIPCLIILIGSVMGKLGGCSLAMKSIGFTWRESIAVGGLMNARGLMELILLNIGLSFGIINQSFYSLLVLMAILTTGMTMPIFRWSLEGQKMAEGNLDCPKQVI